MSFMSTGKIGRANRIARAVVGAAMLAVAFLAVGGALQVVLWVVGAITLLEGLTGFCPLTYMRRRSSRA